MHGGARDAVCRPRVVESVVETPTVATGALAETGRVSVLPETFWSVHAVRATSGVVQGLQGEAACCCS